MRIALIILFVIIAFLQIRPGLNGPDVDHYYALAKTLSLDRDLMLHNQFSEMEYPFTVTGNYHILEWHQIGFSLLMMFVFDLLRLFHFPAQDRFLIVVVNMVDFFVGMAAVYFIYKSVRLFFAKSLAVVSIVSLLFGTNLFAYLFFLNGSAHGLSIFLACFFLWFYLKTRDKRSLLDWLILGFITGFMAMTRGEAVLYTILPTWDLFSGFKTRKPEKTFLFASLYALGAIFTFSPQILFWQIIFGGIYRQYAEADFFTGNKFLEVLFSCSRGFFFFSPLIIISSIAGLGLFFRKNKAVVCGCIFVFLSLLYGLGRAKYGWWQGSSFGGRHFLILLPLMSLPLSAAFERLSSRKQMFIAVLSSIWSLVLFFLYAAEMELDSYEGFFLMFKPSFIRDAVNNLTYQSSDWLFSHLMLKIFFIGLILFLCSLLYKIWKKARPFINSRKMGIFAVIAGIIYVQAVLAGCYFKDQEIINGLKKQGFYKNAVFGDFDKVDVAEAYLEYTVEALRGGRVEEAVALIRRAIRLYPPSQERYFQCLYEVSGDYPDGFRKQFMAHPDPIDYLGLAVVFYKNNDMPNAAYYFKEAEKLQPGIASSLNAANCGYLVYRLDEALSILREIEKI